MSDPSPAAREVTPAADGELMPSRGNGQDWLVAWHPAGSHPIGVPHGAAGICVDSEGNLVLISHDGEHWGFPAGRPEANEGPEDTLRREMLEEACVTVRAARLLGFARSECVNGFQRGTSKSVTAASSPRPTPNVMSGIRILRLPESHSARW